MQLYYITVCKDVVSPSHNTIVLARAPDTGIFQHGGEVFVHRGGGVLEGAAPGQDYVVDQVCLLPRGFGIDADDIKHLVYLKLTLDGSK